MNDAEHENAERKCSLKIQEIVKNEEIDYEKKIEQEDPILQEVVAEKIDHNVQEVMYITDLE